MNIYFVLAESANVNDTFGELCYRASQMPDLLPTTTPSAHSCEAQPKVYIAIFGSRVLPDGSPSGSLRRRIEGGYQCALAHELPCFFVTGGTTNPTIPTEAQVMAQQLMAKGIKQQDLILDHQSTDTLDSVRMASQLLSKNIPILVCSDQYHVLRITLLLRMSGFAARPVWIDSGRAAMGTTRWCYMWFRDLIAMLYDSLLLSYHLVRKE